MSATPSPELSKTRVPDPWETEEAHHNAKRDFTPIRALASERRQKHLWQGVAIVSLLVGSTVPLLIVSQYEAAKSRQPFVYVLDPQKGIHAGPMERLNLNSAIFSTTAINVTQAALQRSPVGLDLPEMVAGLFRADAAEKLKKDVEAQMPDIRARNLHQKPEITQIKALSENGGVRILEVNGQLIRAGSLDGTAISDPSMSFQLVIAVMENGRMNERGQYPFICTDLKLRVGK